MATDDDLRKWMASTKYLPEPLRDFHDQKDVFKAIHEIVNKNEGTRRINRVDAQIYTIDVFLWFMARRGWTLQRSRKDLPFHDLGADVEAATKLRCNAILAAIHEAAATEPKEQA